MSRKEGEKRGPAEKAKIKNFFGSYVQSFVVVSACTNWTQNDIQLFII
jgi:hypothetical protein